MGNSMMHLAGAGLLALATGCASNSGVVPMGQDSYFVSRQAATGFGGAGTLKAEVLREAGQHCTTLNKSIQVVSLTEAKPPFIAGNFPKADLQFRCI